MRERWAQVSAKLNTIEPCQWISLPPPPPPVVIVMGCFHICKLPCQACECSPFDLPTTTTTIAARLTRPSGKRQLAIV